MRFVLEWLDLVLRWTHVFAGILWVGTTYYFTWVGRRLGEEAAGVSIVHGGAFYTVRKQAAPPERLHAFLDWCSRRLTLERPADADDDGSAAAAEGQNDAQERNERE